jgi:hypothetical protein
MRSQAKKRERRKPERYAPFELQKKPDGSYTTWTIGRAWKLKRESPAAWRKLPQTLRRQAESVVRRFKNSRAGVKGIFAPILVSVVDTNNLRWRSDRPAIRTARGAPRKWTKSQVGMFLYGVEQGKKVADAARSIRKTPAEGRTFLSNFLRKHPELKFFLHR